jgi:hypothetical protein
MRLSPSVARLESHNHLLGFEFCNLKAKGMEGRSNLFGRVSDQDIIIFIHTALYYSIRSQKPF